jgi:glycine betaine catabolism B
MQIFLAKHLTQITMYRLMLYFLLVLYSVAIMLGVLNIIAYYPFDIFISGIYLTIICNLSNYLFSKLFRAKTNFESATITALILTLIIGPAFLENIQILTFVGVISMASKYLLAIRKKHIFNPVAIAVFLSALLFKTGASWWIGSELTLPVILMGGILVLAKIKRLEMVASFFAVYFLIVIFLSQKITLNTFLIPSLWFFVFVMLVEPLTSPTTKKGQIIFGGFVALSIFLLPKIIPFYTYGIETALLAGNLLNLAISRPYNVVLVFRKKDKITKNTWSFYFDAASSITFTPGQYLEWTLSHKNSDSRGTTK